MVQINRSNMRGRIRGPSGNNTLLGRLHSFADTVPYLSNLSDIDRLLVLTGSILLGVVTFAYFFLISGIFSSSTGSSSFIGGHVDPRLSNELRKTGLSEEALLRRGGGKRISVGPKQLDSNENAVALDIIDTLNCDALQEELERDWNTVLDGKKIQAENDAYWQDTANNYGGGDYGNVGGRTDDWMNNGEGDIEGFNGADGDMGASGTGNDYNGMGNGGNGGGTDDFVNRRRLFGTDDIPRNDDYNNYNNDYGSSHSEPNNQGLKLTARHLFCLAAEAITLPKSTTASSPDPSTHCDINSFETREELLYLWSSARSQMPEDVIQKTLRLVTEHKETLRGNEVHLWYPYNDKGAEGMLRVLNSGYEGRSTYNFDSEPADSIHDDLYRFHDLPSKFVGENKLFVDVGSALGLTSMLITYLYPKTTIVSIEPASPSWLIQNINYRCNLSHTQLQYIHPILAGVGTKHHDDNDSMMKMLWRPSETTATRNWNPENNFDFASDLELVVHLRTLRAILAEATPEDLPLGTPISVLNLDCEGCEYNLIPSMHETSFNSIGVILGRTNWGYIPVIKKPSSVRARETHERVCTHYNFAKRCKECCDFPSLEVKPRLHGANTEKEEGGDGAFEGERSVAEVAGDMCNDFEKWAKESKLRDIPDDYGWNEMSAFAHGS
mmetsp:Transcript_37929/g.70087  ORF Transcript_37929/g.70087 Transcript_37929/m.70087 type:complete len:667 (+) Transcript_37929:97-2097(+)|eukprot:CAMPEP_0196135894 /NCGR_PEP_ID=MMETSP0910-20130528/4382_1 /TAXON_ID=49265 /ORGANISM="Thalassiosira rotula, Strain GSO102" /LENGTH=666 /DNA_ID=CAMNT_0041396091 /DNA_START=82 /DNA_END=2082 /DNA_ORIENTATION=+